MKDAAESILPFEKNFFLWLNHTHSPFWDSFMWIFTGKIVWIPLVLVILFVVCYKEKWKHTVLLILAIVLVATLCDQIAGSIIKPLFERYRPTHHPDFKDCVSILNGYRGGRYGFVSNHAANAFGVSFFFMLLFKYRPLTIATFSWAIVNSYSRIYLGVHFVSDIIGGAILGTIVGLSVFCLYQYLRKRLFNLTIEELRMPVLANYKARIVIFTLCILVLTIIIVSLLNLYLKSKLIF